MFLLHNFLFLLYFVAVSPSSETSHRDYNVFNSKILIIAAKLIDAVRALKAARSESPDALTALKELGPKLAAIFKNDTPIGSNVTQNPKLQNDQHEESISPETLREDENLIAAAYEALAAASSDSPDVLTALKTLGPKAAALFKSFIPIGSIVTRNPKKVRFPMYYLSDVSVEYYDPYEFKLSDFMETFERHCSHPSRGPAYISEYIISRLVTECHTPLTPEDAQEISSHRVYFMHILLQFKVYDKKLPDLGTYLADFISIRNQFKRDILSEKLYCFTQRYPHYKGAIHALFTELRMKASINYNPFEVDKYSKCLLKHIFLSFNFDHRAIAAFADKLRNELVKLTQQAATCATVVYKKDEKAIEQYQNQFVNNLTLIATHVSQYFNNSLISAWPSTHNGILKEQMLLNTTKLTNVDKNQLKMVANLTRPLLANTGLPNYVYQILIVRKADNKYESYFNRDDTRCTFYKHDSGFHTIIGRIPFNSADQYDKLRLATMIEKQRGAASEVNQTIQSEMGSLYADPTLPMIADSLKKKIGKDILTDYGFSCWGVIREWRWISCPEITYGSSPFQINDLESITYLSYKNRGSFTHDCEDFRFFFFV
ncbi:unnamed protein product [Caenorhabditis nigoni]